MPSKAETAQFLADAHFQLDQGITRIFRVLAPNEADQDALPVKLLEINPDTPEVGIEAVGFNAAPTRGFHHATILMEISDRELEQLRRGELKLPKRWRLAEELFPQPQTTRAAL